jgi:hypothetical protein
MNGCVGQRLAGSKSQMVGMRLLAVFAEGMVKRARFS